MSEHQAILNNRCAFITGAAQGIGAETARRFAEEGAAVYLTDLNAEAVADVAATLRERGFTAYSAGLDVSDGIAVSRAVDNAARELEGLDLVVANAGVLLPGSLRETSLETFERTLRVNVGGVYSTFHAAVPHLQDAGGGQLLATASLAGKAGVAGLSAYCVSKFAVVGLVEALARELGPDGIRVCAVAPGFVETPMLDQFTPAKAATTGLSEAETRAAMISSIPLGRLIAPAEVADTFVYLASPLASAVTGELLTVSGGGV